MASKKQAENTRNRDKKYSTFYLALTTVWVTGVIKKIKFSIGKILTLACVSVVYTDICVWIHLCQIDMNMPTCVCSPKIYTKRLPWFLSLSRELADCS